MSESQAGGRGGEKRVGLQLTERDFWRLGRKTSLMRGRRGEMGAELPEGGRQQRTHANT